MIFIHEGLRWPQQGFPPPTEGTWTQHYTPTSRDTQPIYGAFLIHRGTLSSLDTEALETAQSSFLIPQITAVSRRRHRQTAVTCYFTFWEWRCASRAGCRLGDLGAERCVRVCVVGSYVFKFPERAAVWRGAAALQRAALPAFLFTTQRIDPTRRRVLKDSCSDASCGG